MRIEDVTADNVTSLPDGELKGIAVRANQVYSATRRAMDNVRKGLTDTSADNLPLVDLMDGYALVRAEADRRGLPMEDREIDHRLASRRMRKVVPELLRPMIVRKGVVCLTGEFVKDPRAAACIDVRVDAPELDDRVTAALERDVVVKVLEQAGMPAVVRRDAISLEGPAVALYDLVLVPTGDLEVLDVEELRARLDKNVSVEKSDGPIVEYTSKSAPTEHAATQLDPAGFDDFRRENDKFGSGIHAVWGSKGGKTKLQSVRFNTSFSADEAGKWLTDNKMKSDIEEATGVSKSRFVKSDEERVVGGIVYSADGPAGADAQGDFVDDPKEIWDAMKAYMIAGPIVKFMHGGKPISTPVVECLFTDEPIVKDGEVIPAGSWYMACYIPEHMEELWKAIKDGDIGGFSMAGSATAEEV